MRVTFDLRKMDAVMTAFEDYSEPMPNIRVSEAARFLGVSDDTVRRWTENGILTPVKDDSGRLAVDGLELAHVARDQAQQRLQQRRLTGADAPGRNGR